MGPKAATSTSGHIRRSALGRQFATVTAFMTALLLAQTYVGAAAPIKVGGPFTLTTTKGVTVTDQTYRGKWLLVYFGYTSCPNSCPTTLVTISAALKALGPDVTRVQAVFITIDPQRDTPDRLRDFLLSFDSRIVGLVGTQTQIDNATQAYGAYAIRRSTGQDSKDYSFEHSVYMYLMRPDGTFVRGFDTDWSGERIAAAIRVDMTRVSPEDAAKRTADVGH